MDSFVGYHVSKIFKPSESITKNIDESRRRVYNTGTVQIFIAGPRSLHIRVSDKDIEELSEYIKNTNIFVNVHATYLDHPWNGGPLWFIQKQLDICNRIGAYSFLVHLSDKCENEVIRILKSLKIGNIVLFLEIPSRKPNKSVYASPSTLVSLYNKVKDMNVGICIDTAHVHASGVNLTTREEMQSFMQPILSSIPPDRLLIHLNDNGNALGYGMDKHVPLCTGNIWKDDYSGLHQLFEYIKEYGIHSIIELEERKDILLSKLVIDQWTTK